MSGAPTIQYIITEMFGKDAVVGTDITLPIPVPSQISVLVGAASFADGFPPATRVDPEDGGSNVYGQDVGGICAMLSQYCALMQGGQIVPFSAAAATAFSGYAKGAKVASVLTPGLLWTNNLAGNTVDPDVTPTNWIASEPLYAVLTPTAGAHNNQVLPGASDFALDIDTTAGAANFTGFVAQRDGQKLFISATAANLLQIMALDGGSSAANRIRAASDLGVIQNQTITIQYFASITKWLIV